VAAGPSGSPYRGRTDVMPTGRNLYTTDPRAASTPSGEAYRAYDPAAQAWIRLTWAQAHDRVNQWTRALGAMGLPTGARVAILLPNGLDAMSIDQATLALACVPVPLHAIDNPGSIAYILADCEASLLVLEDAEQWQRIRAVGTALPQLKAVVLTRPGASSDAEGPVPVVALADWLAKGTRLPPLQTPPCAADLAAIVYTSGTTGKPKGVMLTHRNVVSDVKAVLQRIQPTVEDVFLSFLPLSHTFERTAGYYLPMAAGSCVAYARSVALLAEDLRTVGRTASTIAALMTPMPSTPLYCIPTVRHAKKLAGADHAIISASSHNPVSVPR